MNVWLRYASRSEGDFFFVGVEATELRDMTALPLEEKMTAPSPTKVTPLSNEYAMVDPPDPVATQMP